MTGTRRRFIGFHISDRWCVRCGDGEALRRPLRPHIGDRHRLTRGAGGVLCDFCHWWQRWNGE